MLEKLARDKHSGLLQKFVNYGQKSFITLAPGQYKQGCCAEPSSFIQLSLASLFSIEGHESQ
jgi:hypothetical protein